MMYLLRCALLGSLLLTTTALVQASEVLRLVIPSPGILEPESSWSFYEKALHLALSKTASNPAEQIEMSHYQGSIGRERMRQLVIKGEVDVIWSSSTPTREQEMTAVKYSLLRGINEYRLLLIRAEDQARFSKVQTLEQLRAFKIGSGVHWSDTQVYKLNNLPLVTAYEYAPMFRMLAAKRFDYMARGLQEIDHELAMNQHLELAVEEHLLLHYSQPIYFFVNKNKQQLAARIKRGLELAQQDGSLDQLFFSVPSFKSASEKLQQINSRQLINLFTPN